MPRLILRSCLIMFILLNNSCRADIDEATVSVIVRTTNEVRYTASKQVRKETSARDFLRSLFPIEVTSHKEHGDFIDSVMGVKVTPQTFWALLIDGKPSCKGITNVVIDQDLVIELALLPRTAHRSDPLVLKGTVVTPDKVLPKAYVVIQGCFIQSVETTPPKNLPVVDTDGYIFPGFVDVHNHVAWNVFSSWPIRQEKYQNRYEWILEDKNYQAKVRTPQSNLKKDKETFCAMSIFGEVKALVGGTTSIQGTEAMECTRILVRNIDQQAFHEQPDTVEHDVFLRCKEPLPCKTDKELKELSGRIQEGKVEAYLVHLAEGIDQNSREEFGLLKKHGLLREQTVIVHGLALKSAEFEEMAKAGTKLVWSPQSNLALYGKTDHVRDALLRNVKVALAPDWSISGSQNMLGELKVAKRLSKDYGLNLSDKELIRMATFIPAQFLGLQDKIGIIQKGGYADLLVIRRKAADKDPYASLINSREADIKLVLIGGEPLYGDRKLLERSGVTDYEQIKICGIVKGIRVAVAGIQYADKKYQEIESSLEKKLSLENTHLAPLVPCP